MIGMCKKCRAELQVLCPFCGSEAKLTEFLKHNGAFSEALYVCGREKPCSTIRFHKGHGGVQIIYGHDPAECQPRPTLQMLQQPPRRRAHVTQKIEQRKRA